ncbi:MAG TPA: hypothetical protein VM121_06465 [Acidimicrobiales bacterium]|nr:hypothetical protein [Acidimicrobiales bacterium]
MAKIVVTHGVADVDTWLGFKSERADALASLGASNVVDQVAQDGGNTVAVGAEVDDVDGLLTALSSPPPEMAEVMERHGVRPPLTVYVER